MAAPQLDEFERLFEQMSDESIIPEDDTPSDDVLAAELSLGLLSGDLLTQVARRARIDRTFAALVEDWDIRFSAYTDEIAPVDPPKGLLRKIKAEAYPDSGKRIWQSLGIIPAFLGAGAAALVLLIALNIGGMQQPDGPAPSLTAELADDDRSVIVAVAYLEASNSMILDWEVGARPPPERDVEVWVIVEGDIPVSIGVLTQGGRITELNVPADLRDRLSGAVVALTDEPLGGTGVDGPTGPVLAAGEVTNL